MSNVLQFTGATRITPQEIIEDLQARVDAGEVEHLLVVTMDRNTATAVGMTTSPAHVCVYMNQFQRMQIEGLMREKDMVP